MSALSILGVCALLAWVACIPIGFLLERKRARLEKQLRRHQVRTQFSRLFKCSHPEWN
jgi:hypothetical protein